MPAGLAISAFMPTITSNSVFCTRRSNSGLEAMADNNPFVGAMNLDIAGGQAVKLGSGISDIAKSSNHAVAANIISAEESIKNLSRTNKFVNGVGKVLSYTAEHINPIICATGALKVATAKDKKEATIEETGGLGGMFLFEGLYKSASGMPIISKFDSKKMIEEKDGIYKIENGKKKLLVKSGEYELINGKKLVIKRNGWYKKNPFLAKQAEAIKDYSQTKKIMGKSIKFLPGFLKGAGFAVASISGYKLGLAVGDKIIEANRA